MKTILSSVATLLFVQSALAADGLIPKPSEDVLPADTCTKLRDIAKKFKENVEIVNQAVVDAFNHHVTKVSEVLKYVKEYLVEKATNFGCDDVLGPDACKKIQDFAAAAHLQIKESNRAIKEAIVAGATTVQQLVDDSIQFLKSEITCERVLGDQVCATLKEAAKKLHENVNIVTQAVAEAIEHHVTNTKEILDYVRTVMVEMATDFKCSTLISQDLCDKLKSITDHLKLKTDEMTKALKEAIVNGATTVQGIYNRAIGFLLNDVKNLKCEDLISADICTKVTDYAQKLHLTAKDTARAIKEAIVAGAVNANELYKSAIEYLNEQFSCDKVFSVSTCTKIQDLADAFHVSLKKVNDFIRTAVANGVNKVTDLYKRAVKFITDNWNIFGDEPMAKRSVEHDEIKRKVVEAVAKVMDVLLDENMSM